MRQSPYRAKGNDFLDKRNISPSTLLNPVPVVMVSCGGSSDATKSNIITVAWTGTVSSEPPMLSVSIRKSRRSHEIISQTKVFTINLVSQELVRKADFCGVKSGRDVDKFKECNLTAVKADKIQCPMIGESPVNIECRVRDVIELGSHDMFIAEIVNVHVANLLFDDKGKIDLSKAHLTAYGHGEYYALGRVLGFFGFSVASEAALKRREGRADKARNSHNGGTKSVKRV